MKRALFLLAFACVSCTPAIIGVSFAFGGATAAVTYETLNTPERCSPDAGRD